EVIAIAPREVLCELQPVARLARRSRAVAHEFDDRLLLERQTGVHRHELVDFRLELLRCVKRNGRRTELRGAFECERFDLEPLRREEPEDELSALAIAEGDRLPLI